MSVMWQFFSMYADRNPQQVLQCCNYAIDKHSRSSLWSSILMSKYPFLWILYKIVIKYNSGSKEVEMSLSNFYKNFTSKQQHMGIYLYPKSISPGRHTPLLSIRLHVLIIAILHITKSHWIWLLGTFKVSLGHLLLHILPIKDPL